MIRRGKRTVEARMTPKPDRPRPVAKVIPLRNSSGTMQAMTPTGEDMKDWLEAVATNEDRDAFAKLYRHFAPRLVSFLERSGLNGAEAEEVSQEALATVWRRASSYDPRQGAVSTWVFTIARNLRIDRARRAARASAGVAAIGSEAPEMEPSAEDTSLAAERDDRVRKAMATLSPEQATVLRMSFFSEKPHAEIARELCIPLGTVKSRTRLAMSKIRAILEQDI